MKKKTKLWAGKIFGAAKTLFWNFRLHLFVLMLAVTMIPCVLVKEMLLAMYRSQIITERGIEVRYSAQVLANQLGTTSFLEGKVNDTVLTEMTQLADIYSGRIMLINRQYRVVEDTYFIYKDKFCVSNDIFACFKGEGTSAEDRNAGYLRYTIPITMTTAQTDSGEMVTDVIGVLVVTVSISSLMDLVDGMRDKADVLLLTILIIAGAAAFLLSGIYARPFQRMLNNLSQVEDGNLDRTLTPHGFDITRKTTETINKMLVQLQELDKSRQEFVSNVSHELKTPITSIRVLADALMLQDDVPVELYREFMGDISEEIEWETHIINDLLALVKMDRGSASLNVEKVNINNFLEVILRRLKPIAQERDIEMTLELFRPVSAMVDETKMSLAVTNLVENAIKYNHDGGRVRVILNADHKYFFLTVEDNGVGIPQDAIDHIFDRFYRVDKARSREAGGTGLGLAITKSVIQMHGGTIRVESTLGEGTTFSVRVPLKQTTVKDA